MARKSSTPKNVSPALGENQAPNKEHQAAKEAEFAQKQASVPPSANRDVDGDAGKSLSDIIEQKKAKAEADELEQNPPRDPQFYVVEDESDFAELAQKLGIGHDFGRLAALNGAANGVYSLRKGQRVLLPEDYDFSSVDGTVDADGKALKAPKETAAEKKARAAAEKQASEDAVKAKERELQAEHGGNETTVTGGVFGADETAVIAKEETPEGTNYAGPEIVGDAAPRGSEGPEGFVGDRVAPEGTDKG